jgi:hypothetical protein
MLYHIFDFVGSEVLTAVVMKSSIFWDIISCSSMKIKRSFGEARRLHLQGPRISHARNQKVLLVAFHAGFLLLLFFNPKDGNDMLLGNIC